MPAAGDAAPGLILVGFQALTPDGRCHRGLQEADVEILEDGVPQRLALFEGPAAAGTAGDEDRSIPVEVNLLIDPAVVAALAPMLEATRIDQAIIQPLDGRAGITIYTFSDPPRRLCRSTRDKARLARALQAALRPERAQSSLYPVLAAAIRDAARQTAESVKVLMVFSDGSAEGPVLDRPTIEAARAAGVPLYPVLVSPEAPGADPRRLAARRRYSALGEATGGKAYELPRVHPQAVRTVLDNLTAELRTQYVAGYDADLTGQPPRQRKVSIRLPGLTGVTIWGGFREVTY